MKKGDEMRSKMNNNARALKTLIDATAYAVSKDTLKPHMQGILLEPTNTHVTAVSTDGMRLAMITLDRPSFLMPGERIFLDLQNLPVLLCAINSNPDVCVSTSLREMHLNGYNLELNVLKMKGEKSFPPYKQVLPSQNGAAERARTLCNLADARYEAGVPANFRDLSLVPVPEKAINSKHLFQAIKAIGSVAEIRQYGDHDPIEIYEPETANLRAVIMPMRV